MISTVVAVNVAKATVTTHVWPYSEDYFNLPIHEQTECPACGIRSVYIRRDVASCESPTGCGYAWRWHISPEMGLD